MTDSALQLRHRNEQARLRQSAPGDCAVLLIRYVRKQGIRACHVSFLMFTASCQQVDGTDLVGFNLIPL